MAAAASIDKCTGLPRNKCADCRRALAARAAARVATATVGSTAARSAAAAAAATAGPSALSAMQVRLAAALQQAKQARALRLRCKKETLTHLRADLGLPADSDDAAIAAELWEASSEK